MEMETANTPKVYTVKTWEIRLKSGIGVIYNIREDKRESYSVEPPWYVWRWPIGKRESKVLDTEIAAIDYYENEFKELPAYKPKAKKIHGERPQDDN